MCPAPVQLPPGWPFDFAPPHHRPGALTCAPETLRSAALHSGGVPPIAGNTYSATHLRRNTVHAGTTMLGSAVSDHSPADRWVPRCIWGALEGRHARQASDRIRGQCLQTTALTLKPLISMARSSAPRAGTPGLRPHHHAARSAQWRGRPSKTARRSGTGDILALLLHGKRRSRIFTLQCESAFAPGQTPPDRVLSGAPESPGQSSRRLLPRPAATAAAEKSRPTD